MEKLKMQSHDKVGDNVSKIAQLFPNCVTEILNKDGKPQLAIDFEKLQAELSNDIIAEGQERYQFTWPDKRAANRLANTPTTMTLRPCREESVDFDNTQNLYIEGDNLDVLKVLRETYLGKVKMIYIDPPYNTGNDFVYNDEYSISNEEFGIRNGFVDEDGNQTTDPMVKNTESNGRFHTDWLNMIYPRLKVARDFLSEDGVIFISIDDNEITNLRKICDEIFGESNFIAQICRATGTTTAQGTNSMGKSFDYALMYSKNTNFEVGGVELSEKDTLRYDLQDEKGKFSILQLRRTGGEDRREDRPSMYYGIETPDGNIVYPKGPSGYDSRWRVGEETYKQMLKDNLIYFKKTDKGYVVYYKFYLEGRTKRPSNLWTDVEGNKKASIDLKTLIPEKVFETPKPLEMIKRMIQIGNVEKDDIVLDFFSGSSTTAHAIIKCNAEDGGNRKFIMVQLPEKTEENSEAYKAGYSTICEIGKERIRRAGAKIRNNKLDTGFRVLKLDSSNMKDVYYTPSQFTIDDLFDENIKPDRTGEDLLFQIMLELGVELSAKIETKQLNGKKVHFVDDNYLIACFDTDVNESTITEIAKLHPIYFVMRDSSANNDKVIDNFDQIFRHYSPKTTCKII